MNLKDLILQKLISRKIWVRENSLIITPSSLIVVSQCGNCGNSLLRFFWQKFRESNVFTKEITKELISRKTFQ